jgi:hypothetical protein
MAAKDSVVVNPADAPSPESLPTDNESKAVAAAATSPAAKGNVCTALSTSFEFLRLLRLGHSCD